MILDNLIRIIFKIVNFCYTVMYEKIGHGLMSVESKMKW